jgi:hypothetical protein
MRRPHTSICLPMRRNPSSISSGFKGLFHDRSFPCAASYILPMYCELQMQYA